MEKIKKVTTDVVIVGTGVSGLFCALHLPKTMNVTMITKSDMLSSDSFLAQGGICVLKNQEDYDSYYEDTMKAGHYKNNPESVDIMISSSREIIRKLVDCGVVFEQEEGEFLYTREGAHSTPRILFHQDITGKEITTKLLEQVKKLANVTILEYTTMVDIIEKDGLCQGILAVDSEKEPMIIKAKHTVLASGGIGGLYTHSTNFEHLTGDALAIAIKHHIPLQDIDYVQIHPTTFYSEKSGRRFLISESVRGEGAVLYNKKGERFVNELLPRDQMTKKIYEQMQEDETPYVMLSMKNIPESEIKSHFPNIYQYCLDEGFDVTKESIPVVPAQHYFMGGIKVDKNSMTELANLYAVGETSCNGVHGANRLASNSLLESLVFSELAANHIIENAVQTEVAISDPSDEQFFESIEMEIRSKKQEFGVVAESYKKMILSEMERKKKERE